MTEVHQVRLVHTKQPSLMVAPIGNAFMPGTRESLEAAAVAYGKAGGQCKVEVQPNLTVIPPLGLGDMRNFAIEKAVINGFDYLMIIDNDVLVDAPDTFIKLVGRSKQYLTPWFDQSPIGRNILIQDPMYNTGQGLLKLNWTVPYCNLFQVQMFRQLQWFRPFTGAAVYQEDEFNSLHFRCRGVDIWQDTDTPVKLLRGPRMLWEMIGDKVRILKPFENP